MHEGTITLDTISFLCPQRILWMNQPYSATKTRSRERAHATFHPWDRILWETNDWGHCQLMGRDLGWAGVLKLIFVAGYTLCYLSVGLWASLSGWYPFTWKVSSKKSSGMCNHKVISNHCFPESTTAAGTGWGLMVNWRMGKLRKEKSKCQEMHYEMFMAWFIWEIHFIRQYFE